MSKIKQKINCFLGLHQAKEIINTPRGTALVCMHCGDVCSDPLIFNKEVLDD